MNFDTDVAAAREQNPREGSALNTAPCDDEPAKGLTSNPLPAINRYQLGTGAKGVGNSYTLWLLIL